MKSEYYQQGDVIVERVEAIPQGEAVPPEGRRLILAKGELTGHVFETPRYAALAAC